MSAPKIDAKVDEQLAKTYALQGDKQAHYDSWADTYESDVVDALGYVGHLRGSEIFSTIVTDKNCKILDMGCGTGLVGKELHNLGYRCIDGADFSAEMLTISARRGVYRALHQHDITTPLQLETAYDARISVGLFSYGIPYISDLHNVLHGMRSGAPCVVTVNGSAWHEHNLEAALYAEADKHQFTVEQIIETEYIHNKAINAQVLVIRS